MAANEGFIQGVVASRNDPRISHLFFVDDSLLFCRAESSDYRKVMEILKTYEKASGQVINIAKSGILFSASTSMADKNTMMDILNVHKSMRWDNYLGLPLLIGRSKRIEFRTIKERIWVSCLMLGRETTLSSRQGSHDPGSCTGNPFVCNELLRLPKGFIHELNMIIAGYW